MDPITSSLIPVLFNQGIEIVKKRIERQLNENQSVAIQKSLSELKDLLRIVEERLKKVENQQELNPNYQSADYYHLINKAFQSTSNFPYKYKTEILAELILKRLFNSPKNEENLLISVAAERLEYLSIKHLKILGVMYTLGFNNLYNRHFKELNLEGVTPQSLDKRLSYIKNEELTIEDFKFISGIGVIDIIPPALGSSRSFNSVIFSYPYEDTPITQEFKVEFSKTEVGQILQKESLKIESMLLNSFGVFIGRESSKIFEKVEY